MDNQTMGMIGLGVLVLASVVVAYFSAKSWHWGHVVLVLAVFFAGVGAAILTAESMKIRGVYQAKAAKLEIDIEKRTAQNSALEFGSFDDQLISTLSNERDGAASDALVGNVTLKSQLKTITRSRGRVWRGAQPIGETNPQTGAVEVGLSVAVAEGEAPRGPHGIQNEMVVYIFEDGLFNPQNPPQYLGEFQVFEVAADRIKISPTLIHSWSDEQRNRLARSQSTWSLYEMMPTDRHDLFAMPQLSTEERIARLKTILPASSVDEYIRDGQPATPDDDPSRVVPYTRDNRPLSNQELADIDPGEIERRYVRPQRAYGYLFSELARRRVVMFAELDAVGNDTQRLAGMTQSAQKDFATRQREKADTEHDLDGFRRDKEAAGRYLAAIEVQRDAATAMLKNTLETNRRLASELAIRHLGILNKFSNSGG